jgi:UDP-glucose-4-epimerase GalE
MTGSILVAGGAGYIGAHVAKALATAGIVPVVLDDLSSGHRAFVRWGPLYTASVTDSASVREAVAAHNIKAVIDLAGSIEVGESVADPLKYYRNNVSAKVAFLQTLRDCGVSAFVFSSSAAVYGNPTTLPIREDAPTDPTNPYGRTKLIFEQMLHDFEPAGGPRFMALRYFNAAGASANGKIGEAHQPETHLIPRACLAALRCIPALEIFGNDYPTPDGTAIRDYLHVEDLASAHVLAAKALMEGAPSTAYNLGRGTGASIAEVMSAFTVLGHPVPHRFAPRRAGDPAILVADTGKVRTALGWRPHYQNLGDIIASAYSWHRSQLKELERFHL